MKVTNDKSFTPYDISIESYDEHLALCDILDSKKHENSCYNHRSFLNKLQNAIYKSRRAVENINIFT
jgi:hypothetical protein